MSTPEPPRFKRRKTTHAKRLPASSFADSPDTADADADADDGLKDVLRNRKRSRPRETKQKTGPTQSQALVAAEVPAKSAYESRFVPQTGEVFQRDDQQMTEYVEARLAEKNHRLYGWPIPKHLKAPVAALAPEHRHVASTTRNADDAQRMDQKGMQKGSDDTFRVAAGMGKLEEVDLGPSTSSQSVDQREKARSGKSIRQKRRNSEDVRRDQMVEAVLRESKLDYFEEDKIAEFAAGGGGGADNDDAMVEKFRLEFLESMEARQRKPAPATAKGVKGAKEAPKGPKLGGSRSARAAMRLLEEQAGKKK